MFNNLIQVIDVKSKLSRVLTDERYVCYTYSESSSFVSILLIPLRPDILGIISDQHYKNMIYMYIQILVKY